MIITRAGHKVGLFGGSSDYSSFYNKYGGLVLGMAIDKYVYVSLRKNANSNYKTRITYSIIEDVQNNSEIQNNGIRGTLEYFGITEGVSVGLQSDVNSQSGLGSSSAMIVALCKAIDIYQHGHETMTWRNIADATNEIERVRLGEPGGHNDPIISAHGSLISTTFYKDGRYVVRPMPVSEEFRRELLDRMVMVYLGGSRNSFEVARSHDNKNEVTSAHKQQIVNLAQHAMAAFEAEDIDELARLLHKSWLAKKSTSDLISNSYIDKLYDKGMESGGLAGKVLGAGNGGSMLFMLAEGVNKNDFSDRLGLEMIDFGYSNTGVEVLLK